ncbi:MAG TPA: nuclear transport factor 2 family protein [Pyrinomonadaceae bacterium]|jgi:ketosteroid isomerase-like protein|nr:nuclear transport factor 2 family protein [Pyrinomonadaceae bacterium]
MERGSFGADVSPTDNTVPIDTERTVASPRFDDKSVQRARPAVSLAPRGRARTWPLAIVFACILAGLAGGMLGGIALMKYQGTKSRTEPPSAPAQPTVEGQTKSDSQSVNSQQEAANQQAADGQPAANDNSVADSNGEEVGAATDTRAELRASLNEWIAATNARDVGKQMTFYAPNVEAFYLARNASRAAVREEKSRLFSQARAVDVRASEPEIRMGRDGRTAVMRFRKRYQIDERGGEVLQELRWRRTDSGWRIVGERDLRVIQ